jgi:hypothetical protein
VSRRDLLNDIKEGLPPTPLFMSGCWRLQARLDLYMLGQCLFVDAMLLICSPSAALLLLSTDSCLPFVTAARLFAETCAHWHCSVDRPLGAGER